MRARPVDGVAPHADADEEVHADAPAFPISESAERTETDLEGRRMLLEHGPKAVRATWAAAGVMAWGPILLVYELLQGRFAAAGAIALATAGGCWAIWLMIRHLAEDRP